MNYTECSVADFTVALASKTSVPGGGGASALAGAIGIALGDMVGEFTVGKKKYAQVEEEMRGLMEEAQSVRRQLIHCIEEDAESFEPLSKAYGIPKDDPKRDEIMESCLKVAAEVPMKILRLSCQAVDLLARFGEIGSVIVISDAATGAAICRAAIMGAAVNVRINTKSMKDRAFAGSMNEETEALLTEYLPKADAVYQRIYATY